MSKFIYHPLTTTIFTLVAIVFFISLSKSAKKTEISSNNIKILEKEVLQISNDVIEIEEKIIETESDFFKEKVIRNELLLQKPGEKVIQLPSLEEQKSVREDSSNSKKPIDQWIKLLGM